MPGPTVHASHPTVTTSLGAFTLPVVHCPRKDEGELSAQELAAGYYPHFLEVKAEVLRPVIGPVRSRFLTCLPDYYYAAIHPNKIRPKPSFRNSLPASPTGSIFCPESSVQVSCFQDFAHGEGGGIPVCKTPLDDFRYYMVVSCGMLAVSAATKEFVE